MTGPVAWVVVFRIGTPESFRWYHSSTFQRSEAELRCKHTIDLGFPAYVAPLKGLRLPTTFTPQEVRP